MTKPFIQTNWEDHACDICGAEDVHFLGHREYKVAGRSMDFHMTFEDVCCNKCAFVFEKKRPNEAFLFDFYRDAHNRYDSKVLINVDYDIDARLRPIKDHVAPGSTILEVGASTGHFCETLNAEGYKAQGLDPLDQEESADQVEKGFITAESQGTYSGPQYDAIVSYYVLEHVRDANEWINGLSAMLKDGGYIFIEVPDYRYYPYNSLTFEHMFHFRAEHTGLLFEKHSFDVVTGHDYKASRYFGFVTVAQKKGNRSKNIAPEFDVEKIKEEAVALYSRSKEIELERQELASTISKEIEELIAKKPESKIYVWGANDYATNIGNNMNNINVPITLLDNSETKIGTYHEGFNNPIERPELKDIATDSIFVLCSPNWNKDIMTQISNAGLKSYSFINGTSLEKLEE